VNLLSVGNNINSTIQIQHHHIPLNYRLLLPFFSDRFGPTGNEICGFRLQFGHESKDIVEFVVKYHYHNQLLPDEMKKMLLGNCFIK